MPAYRFVGERADDGTPREFHEGVPARDLSASEYAALPEEHRAIVRGSRLYERGAVGADEQPEPSPEPAVDAPAQG